MVGLLGAFGFALVLLLLSTLGTERLERRVEDGTEVDRQDLRAFAERGGQDAFLVALAVLCVVAAVFQVVRDRPLGWAWFGVAAVYLAVLMAARRRRARLLELLGDRGRVERQPRYERRRRLASWFGVLAVVGWAGQRVVEYAYPSALPDGAVAATVVLAALMGVGIVGFLGIRVWMWARGDDLPGTPLRG